MEKPATITVNYKGTPYRVIAIAAERHGIVDGQEIDFDTMITVIQEGQRVILEEAEKTLALLRQLREPLPPMAPTSSAVH